MDSTPTGRVYSGTESVQICRRGRQDPRAWNLVREALSISYWIHLGAQGRCFIEGCFRALDRMPPDASLRVLEQAFAERRCVCRKMGLLAQHSKYKEASLLRSIRVAGVGNMRGDVVDVGANDNTMGRVLLRECPEVASVTGADVEDRTAGDADPRLRFVVQADPSRLPLASASADTVIFRYSLHHMSSQVQVPLLREANRALRPGGRIVIYEDTVSLRSRAIMTNHVSAAFRRLADGERWRLVLSLLDASSCFVVEETMPFAFSFRSLETWLDVLRHVQFRPIVADYWGFTFFSLFAAPMGVIVCEKTAQ